MNGSENQMGPARVRHVPIKVESRDDRPRQGRSEEPIFQPHHHRNYQQQHQPHYQYECSSQTIPDTSSININYKPTLPKRQTDDFKQQRQPRVDPYDRQHAKGQQFMDDSNPKVDTSNSDVRNRDRHRSPESAPSPNSDKLVNSPEPIPLPPPPPMSSESCSPSHETASHFVDSEHSKSEPTNQPGSKSEPNANILGAINSVKKEVTTLLQEIIRFNGTSSKSKEFRYLEEMLTRCVLNLDNIQCGDSADMRQHRRATIKLVDRATDILQKKLQLNSDIQELSESMVIS